MDPLSEEEREEIKQMYYAGMNRKDIAEEKGISRRYVDAIINNRDVRCGYRTSCRRKPPAGRITFEMIRSIKDYLKIGSAVIVDTVEEDGGYTYNGQTKCKVTGKYKHIFTVQVGKCVSAFKYVDLLLKDGVKIGE